MSDYSSLSRESTVVGEIVDERKPIDKNLPPLHRLSLGDWIAIWRSLANSNNSRDRDIFALTGHFTDPDTGERRRAEIDLSTSRPRDSHVLHQVCDIDSVIGIVLDDLPILPGAIVKYYMLQSVTHTLDADLHIPPVLVRATDGSSERVYMHKVPNARFIELEPRALVRIHFPRLTPQGKSVCVSEEHMAMLYDSAIYPAAVDILPEDLIRGWASKYGDEKLRAKAKRTNSDKGPQGRTLQQTGRDVHARFLNAWVRKFREIIENTHELRWARCFFFGVEMRGMKNREASLHPPPEEPLVNDEGEIEPADNPRTQAVDTLLENFDSNLFEPGSWFLDIATTVTVSDDIHLPSACTFASAGMHAHLLSHFTGLDWEDCVRYVAGRGNHYQKDEVAHLNDLAGFRFVNPDWERSGVYYLQVYSTDKSVTYNVDAVNNAQRTSAKRILESWDSELRDHIAPLLSAFGDSLKTHGVALRIESRVDFLQYPNCHLHIPERLLERCVYRIDRWVFWGWKVSRLFSIRAVLSEWIAARAKFTSDQLSEAGTLLITLAWMMNALVNRPDSGGTWDEVHDAACVHAMVDGRLVPIRPLGGLFLPVVHFRNGKQPRCSSQRALVINTICYLLGTKDDPVTEMDVFLRITKIASKPKRRLEEDPWSVGKDTSRSAPAPRHSNKQRRIHIMSGESPEDQFSNVVRESERERYPSEDEDPEEREAASPRSLILTRLIHSYPVQIIAKAPNRARSNESWCRLDAKQRTEVTFDLFCTMDGLREAFESYMLFPCEVDKWERTVENLFPTIDHWHATQDYQGLPALTVRENFVQLLRSMPAEERAFVVAQARQYVSKRWAWLPYGPGKKHLWATGKSGLPKTAMQTGPVPGGPWIVLNPARLIR